MTRVRSALYVDFDNLYSGLYRADRTAAERFAREPGVWLSRLADDRQRDWRVLRCYANPGGRATRTDDEPSPAFGTYRAAFVSAGFDVIDCPRLTVLKNAADIRMVVDVMDALWGPYDYDEFVIGSGDSDVHPLVSRLRAANRRVGLMASTDAAQALRQVADEFVDRQRLVELVGERSPELPGGGVIPLTPRRAQARKLAERAIRAEYDAAATALSLSLLGQRVRQTLGAEGLADQVSSTWFGAGGLKKFVESLHLPDAELTSNHLKRRRRTQPG